MRIILVTLALVLVLGKGSSNSGNKHTEANLLKLFKPDGMDDFCDTIDEMPASYIHEEIYMKADSKEDTPFMKLLKFVSYDGGFIPSTGEVKTFLDLINIRVGVEPQTYSETTLNGYKKLCFCDRIDESNQFDIDWTQYLVIDDSDVSVSRSCHSHK